MLATGEKEREREERAFGRISRVSAVARALVLYWYCSRGVHSSRLTERRQNLLYASTLLLFRPLDRSIIAGSSLHTTASMQSHDHAKGKMNLGRAILLGEEILHDNLSGRVADEPSWNPRVPPESEVLSSVACGQCISLYVVCMYGSFVLRLLWRSIYSVPFFACETVSIVPTERGCHLRSFHDLVA